MSYNFGAAKIDRVKKTFMLLLKVSAVSYTHLINGIHVHLHSQELSADILSGYHKKMFALARRIQDKSGAALDYINFGSGLGITFAESNKPLDLSAVAASFEAERAE